jgi:hypothetical protein
VSGERAVRKATDPISFEQVQLILTELGYKLVTNDKGSPVLHWEKGSELLTTLKPDFAGDAPNECVYSRSYVIDLLFGLLGERRQFFGRKILAVLRSASVVNAN